MTRSSRARSETRFSLDANILVYALNTNGGARHFAAKEIVDQSMVFDCWLTLQAVSEFYSSATRKSLVPSADAAAQVLDWLELFPTVAVSPSAIRRALRDSLASRASYWDALLLATAAEAGCTLVLSEGMADDAVLSGVRVHKPFTADGVLSDLTRQLLDL
ncbi:MAG: PIN domain-containing protein [Stellaceae bacterium]